MRLTHAITMQDPNRANLEVTVLPDGDALPITLEQDGGAGEPDVQTVYLSFEQYDVMAELVQRVRPGGGPATRSGWGLCGHPGDTHLGTSCVLKTGHGWAGDMPGERQTIFHIDEDGRIFTPQATP